MPICSEIREQACELLCSQMPQELALLVLGYWGLPTDCEIGKCSYNRVTERWFCESCRRWGLTGDSNPGLSAVSESEVISVESLLSSSNDELCRHLGADV